MMSSALEITFLGTGTSVGVPMVGCDCETCRSNDPRDKRLRSSIYVTGPDCAFIVDTGPDFRTQCLRESIRRVDAVIVTHPHMDHLTGFDDLRRFTVAEDASMPVHARAVTIEALRRMFHFAFDPVRRWRGYLKVEPQPVDGPFRLGGLEIVPLEVQHGSVETMGVLIIHEGRKLCGYFSDVKTMPQATVEALRGVDTLIVDALRHTPHPTHMNFTEALALADELKPRQTWFTHIQCEIMHAREEPKLPSGVKIAYDGLKLRWPL